MHKHEPAYLMDLASRVLGSQAKAAEWLRQPRVQLGGRTPLVALATPEGARRVEELLRQIDDDARLGSKAGQGGAEASEADLAQARLAVHALLEEMAVRAHLYAVEPKEGRWAVIVECATASGWQRTELGAGPELLAAGGGDAAARAALIAHWRPRLLACKKG